MWLPDYAVVNFSMAEELVQLHQAGQFSTSVLFLPLLSSPHHSSKSSAAMYVLLWKIHVIKSNNLESASYTLRASTQLINFKTQRHQPSNGLHLLLFHYSEVLEISNLSGGSREMSGEELGCLLGRPVGICKL